MTFVYALKPDFSGMNNIKFSEWQECCFASRQEAIDAGFAENPTAKIIYTAQVMSAGAGYFLSTDDARDMAVKIAEAAAKFRPLRFSSAEAADMFDPADLSYLALEEMVADFFQHIADWFNYADRIFWADHICSHENPDKLPWWRRWLW